MKSAISDLILSEVDAGKEKPSLSCALVIAFPL